MEKKYAVYTDGKGEYLYGETSAMERDLPSKGWQYVSSHKTLQAAKQKSYKLVADDRKWWTS